MLGLCLLVALMTTGSQVAARRVTLLLCVSFARITWDPDSQEFVVYMYTYPAVAESLIRGDLRAIVSVEGLWWSPSENKTPQPLLAKEVEEFAVGSPDLMGPRQGAYVPPRYRAMGTSKGGGKIRVPWKPMRVGSGFAYVVRVNAALVNREGEKVGRESSLQAFGGGFPLFGWLPADPRTIRSDAFITEAWAWLSDPERNRAPFRFRPPPPPGVIREGFLFNPRK
ncbi:MAG: hypothetical protein O7H41_02735 [Planctomycetota bacterium]|nr:hypothetical protein [Planctomycetota bacterium]